MALSIQLTFSEDGEHLQLSRMDAAILLTWVLGGDHDNEPPIDLFSAMAGSGAPSEPEQPKTPTPPRAPASGVPVSSAGLLSREQPVPEPKPEQTPVMPPELFEEKAPTTGSQRIVRQPLPTSPPAPKPSELSVEQVAAKVTAKPPLKKPVKPATDVPFQVTIAQEAAHSAPPPTPGELIEDDPYWEYQEGPAPVPAPKPLLKD